MCSDPLKLFGGIKRGGFRALYHREEGRDLREQHEKQSYNESSGRPEDVDPADVGLEERQCGRDRHQRPAVEVREQLKPFVRVFDR